MSTPVLSDPDSLKMARSPIFYTGKNNTLTNDSLDAMALDIKIWSGAKGSPPTPYNYELVKNYSINEVINFEISDLIRSEFSHDFNIYNAQGYEQSPDGEALWVGADGEWTYSNNGATLTTANWGSLVSNAFLTTDGWSPINLPGNNAVTTPVLAVARNRRVLRSNYEVLAIYNSVGNDLGEIEISWSNGDADVFYVSAISASPPDPTSSNSSRDYVIYAGVGPANLDNNPYLDNVILPSNHSDGEYYDVILKDTGGDPIASVRYYLVCEDKYTPYQVAFVNRYGVMDYLTFFKRTDETGSFTNESYMRSIYADGFTVPSLGNAQYQDFNINSRNTMTMNTGFVDEAYNDVMEDLMMSEYVGIKIGNSWIAAFPDRGSIDYVKEVNERLINYQVSFRLAFNERTLLR
jgi:hypothetical protein